MALSIPFGLVDVLGEFGTNTRPSGDNLRAAYVAIFGSVTEGVSRLSDFDGYGKPTLTWNSASSDDDSFTVNFDLNVGSLSTEYRIKWDDNVGFTSPTYTTWTTQGTNATGLTDSVTGLSASTTYYYIVQARNAFNDGAEADYTETISRSVSTTAPPVFTTPFIDACSNDSFQQVTAEWDYGNDPSTFSAEIRINGGSWTTPASLASSSNWGSSTNPKSGTWNSTNLFNFGDTVEIRIRADAEGGTSASAWSSPCSSTA